MSLKRKKYAPFKKKVVIDCVRYRGVELLEFGMKRTEKVFEKRL